LIPITVAAGTAGTAITITTQTGSSHEPIAIAITPNGAKAYIASSNQTLIHQVTIPAKTHGTQITVGSTPDAIAITPSGTKAYVTNSGSASVTPITLATGTPGSAIQAGTEPDAIAITPSGTTAYVTNRTARTVTPITLSTGTKGTAITTATSAQSGIVIRPNGSKAYVTSDLHPASVTPITLSAKSAGSPVSMGATLSAIAITSGGTKAYVAGASSAGFIPVTLTSTKKVTATPTAAYTGDGQRCWYGASTSAGSCTSPPSGAVEYGWNVLGDMCWSGSATVVKGKTCTSPPAGVTNYSYNGDGLRTKETPPSGSSLTFTWDTVTGSGVPLDIDDGTNDYIYGPVLFGGTAPVEQINLTTGSVDYLASTPSGVQAVFNSSGALQEQAAYTTYGTQILQKGTSKVTPFGFQGSYTDTSGLIYLINRYYTPGTDQFLSVDPKLATTGQAYAFTGDDPLNATDPLGLSWTDPSWVHKGAHWFRKHVHLRFDPKAGLEAAVNIGRGASFGLTDKIDNAIRPGSANTVPHNSVDEAIGGAAASVAGGSLLRGAATGTQVIEDANGAGNLVRVTSWAASGEDPDLAAGRWVMRGGPTRFNWLMSGRVAYPFENSITGFVPESELSYPSGWESVKGIIGQNRILPFT
jgi:RHS repeat-associated protein